MRETREGWERGGDNGEARPPPTPTELWNQALKSPTNFPISHQTKPVTTNSYRRNSSHLPPLHIIPPPPPLISCLPLPSTPLPHAVTCWFLTQSIDYNSTYRLCYWTLSIAHHHNILINLHSLLRVITSLCGKEPVPWCNNDVNLDLSGPWELNGGKFSLLFSLFLFFFLPPHKQICFHISL